ncbi:hypothetical protein PIIN_10729 [Serendipita indica DSM 11827]|uniref:Uncharacterized protein n=1 Tax=Serendipita indica (strain DSM 11827) TaxID=1109443 RepID=G4TZJ8_SERID|nr:hypothetical protein PIIN_10729 [Serendipita indica DSM 11827]
MRTVGGSFRTDGLIEAIKPTSIRALCLNSLMDMVIHEAPTASEPNPLHGMQAVACRDACVGAVCCDVTLPDSLEYLERFCAPRAMEYTMNAPIIVVGTKSALEKPISIDEESDRARQYRASSRVLVKDKRRYTATFRLDLKGNDYV